MVQLHKRPGVESSTEEVRVAMALNGGVSLAVWMGGCAVELDSARRAHLGPEDLDYGDYEPDALGGTTTRRLYNGICKAFGRRLSLDILTGASAGGINGALLGAAAVSGRRLHPRFVRERWLELGDLALLLRDPAEKDPRALMDGELFHDELLRAFLAVCDEDAADGAAPDDGQKDALAAARLPSSQRGGDGARLVPDLDVTMTDVIGVERTFPDEWGHQLFARAHAPRFKFREADHYTAATLAAAARTSASFPVAFEPWKVEGEAAARADLTGPTYGIDGGVLDNAPIDAALALIPFRRAGARVRRYACYMNADPAQPEPSGEGGEPEVEDVIGYVVGLPRTAPFVDQLYAVREAVNRPLVTRAIVKELLQMDLGALEETANALLPAYRRRRTARSIEELVPEPVAARALRRAIPPEGDPLPWIPDGDRVGVPDLGTWSWGLRPAQRILYLLLDLLREALGEVRGESEEELLALRLEIDGRLERLEEIRQVMSARLGPLLAASAHGAADAAGPEPEGDGLSGIEDAARVAAAREGEVYSLVADAAEQVRGFGGLDRERDPDGFGPGENFAVLFEPGEGEERYRPPLEVFFRRVLAIEVVRRALSDEVEIETAQELSFVQLTPSAPSPIFLAEPLSAQPPPAQAKDKLAGVGLGHFAGFYRRSWRANDFMWGRLDAAARVVDLLLDRPPEPRRPGPGAPGSSHRRRARILASSVLGAGASAEQRWLVQEALADHGALSPTPAQVLLDSKALTVTLMRAIEAELKTAGPAPRVTALPLIRAVCTRAAQLEVIRDELPILIEEAKADGERGSSGRPLELGEGGLRSQIEALRAGEPLPRRLIDEGEAVSDLGLGTIARTSRVGISMLESTAVPLTKALGVVRVPALAIAGVVAPQRLHRATAACGFSASAIYLSSRIVTAEHTEPPFSAIWSPPVLLSLLAALIVVAAIAVPLLQSINGIRRSLNAARAIGLIACGGFVAGLLALWAKGGGFDLEQVLLCPGAENPSETIVTLALAATAGLATLRLPLFSDTATGLIPRGGRPLCLLLIAVSLMVAIASAVTLGGEIDGGWWTTISVILALPGAPLVALLFLQPWKPRGLQLRGEPD